MNKIKFIERWASHSKFFAIQGIFNSYKKFRRKIIGCENNHLICCGKRGNVYVFYDKKELENSGITGYYFLKNKKGIVRYINESKKAKNKYLKICFSIYRNKFIKFSNKKLSIILKKLFYSYTELMAYYRMSAEEFYIMAEEKIKNKLSKYIPNRNLNKIYQILTNCELNRLLANFKEKKDWLSLLIKLKNKNQKNISTNIQKHASNYGFLGAGGGNPFGWDFNFFIKKYQIDSKKKLIIIKKEYNEIKQLDKKIIQEKKHIISKYQIPKDIKKLTENIGLMTYHRMTMREEITKGAYLSRNLFNQIYGLIEKTLPLNLEFDISRQLSFEEMYNFLISKKIINYKDLYKRYKLFVYILNKNKLNLYTEEKANNFIKKYNLFNKIGNKSNLIKGKAVYSGGIIYGRAMVIDNARHSLEQQKLAAIMKDGEILVTGMTRPTIISACEKASAIITDEGGVTCHAAIITRELKKPCITATRNATKIIKTGDYLKVNSKKGVVEIIPENIYKEIVRKK